MNRTTVGKANIRITVQIMVNPGTDNLDMAIPVMDSQGTMAHVTVAAMTGFGMAIATMIGTDTKAILTAGKEVGDAAVGEMITMDVTSLIGSSSAVLKPKAFTVCVVFDKAATVGV